MISSLSASMPRCAIRCDAMRFDSMRFDAMRFTSLLVCFVGVGGCDADG